MKKITSRKISTARQKAIGVVVELGHPHAHHGNMENPGEMRVSLDDFKKHFVPYKGWDKWYAGQHLCLCPTWDDDPEWVGRLFPMWDATHGGWITVEDAEANIEDGRLDYDYVTNHGEYPIRTYYYRVNGELYSRKTDVIKYHKTVEK